MRPPLGRQHFALGHLLKPALGVAAHVDPRIDPGLLQGVIARFFPAAPESLEVGGAGLLPLSPLQGWIDLPILLARPAFLRRFTVVAFEILLGIALDAVHLTLTEHQVDVGLIFAV